MGLALDAAATSHKPVRPAAVKAAVAALGVILVATFALLLEAVPARPGVAVGMAFGVVKGILLMATLWYGWWFAWWWLRIVGTLAVFLLTLSAIASVQTTSWADASLAELAHVGYAILKAIGLGIVLAALSRRDAREFCGVR